MAAPVVEETPPTVEKVAETPKPAATEEKREEKLERRLIRAGDKKLARQDENGDESAEKIEVDEREPEE